MQFVGLRPLVPLAITMIDDDLLILTIRNGLSSLPRDTGNARCEHLWNEFDWADLFSLPCSSSPFLGIASLVITNGLQLFGWS